MFLLHHKKNASNHLFSKQLKKPTIKPIDWRFHFYHLFKFRMGVQVRAGQKPQKQHALFCPTRPERAEAPSPGQRPG